MVGGKVTLASSGRTQAHGTTVRPFPTVDPPTRKKSGDDAGDGERSLPEAVWETLSQNPSRSSLLPKRGGGSGYLARANGAVKWCCLTRFSNDLSLSRHPCQL